MIIRIINRFVSYLKGEKFLIDERLDLRYLTGFLFSRVLMLFTGFLNFSIKRRGLLFIDKKVKILAGYKIVTGNNLVIGSNCYIDAMSTEGIKFGSNVSIGKRTSIECTGSVKTLGKGFKVGNNVGLGSDCFYGCAGGIDIGSDTIVGNYVSFHSENHNFNRIDVPIRLQGVSHKGIIIGSDCWIGAKVTILDGAHVENGCIITAGAVVTSQLYKAFGIYGGIPAKLIKMRGGRE